ncbi:MAG TPA: hypothetical protein VK277_07540 [Acidimicrobiales bacterium]|nr:hypothetical protein [Acidimicrobiales bacterium]
MTDASGSDGAVSFATQIKPLFREKDQQAMSSAFDLWSYDDVRAHASAIVAKLRAGSMPCDGARPEVQVDLFQHWIEGGKLP